MVCLILFQIEGAVGCWHIIPTLEFPIVIGTSDIIHTDYFAAATGTSSTSRAIDVIDGNPTAINQKNRPAAAPQRAQHPPVACTLRAAPDVPQPTAPDAAGRGAAASTVPGGG